MFLVDDHRFLRLGIRTRLEVEPDLEVVGESGHAAEALEQIGRVRPDVAVVDINLRGGDGLELAGHIRTAVPEAKVIVYSASEDHESLYRAIVAGASAYVLKDDDPDQLVATVRAVGIGETMVDGILARYMDRRALHVDRHTKALGSLTPQERRVLDLLGRGLTNRQIGQRLFLSEKTVRNHVSNVLRKLQLSHRTQAAIYLLEQRRT